MKIVLSQIAFSLMAGSILSVNTINTAPAKAAIMQLNFSSPSENGVPESVGSIFFDSSKPNESTSPDLGVYNNAVTNYNLNIADKVFSPGVLSNSGEPFKLKDAKITINKKISSINFTFGRGAELNFKFAPGTIGSTALPSVGTIGSPSDNSATFTPGSRYTAYLNKTSVTVITSSDITPTSASVPESSSTIGIVCLGAVGTVNLIQRRLKKTKIC
jgi:hypothetical protein